MRDLSARTLDEVRPVPTRRIKEALTALEENLGGREALASILSKGSFSNDEEKFVAILGDPESDGTPLANLLGTFGLSPARFFKLLSEAKAIQAVFASMDHIYRRLPAVAEHTMVRALPSEEPCARCEGTGKFLKKPAEKEREEEWGTCGDCKGLRVIKRVPELDEVKLALQVGGLMKGGQTTITYNSQVDARALTLNGGAPGGADHRAIFRDFSEASDRVLYGRQALPAGGPLAIPESNSEVPEVVEAEVVEEEAPQEPPEPTPDVR